MYQFILATKVQEITDKSPEVISNPVEKYNAFKIAMEEASEVLPDAPIKINGKIRYMGDSQLRALKAARSKISQRLNRTKNTRSKELLVKRRNSLLTNIRSCIRDLETERFDQLAAQIEGSRDSRKLHEARRLLSNSDCSGLRLMNAQGYRYETPELMEKPIREHYFNFFEREGSQKLDEWRGVPRPLLIPISAFEVENAAKRLSNNRAIGPDGIAGEFFKYGGDALYIYLEETINLMFIKHEAIPEFKMGYLYPINKPGKPYLSVNTRPVVLLIALQKILSLVVLERFMDKVNEFLPYSQHAYRSGRSTTEAVWTAKWISVSVEKWGETARRLGIDLSKAFDSLDRCMLIDIFSQYNLATEDELRIITFLLSETTLQVKIGQFVGDSFETTIGTPQGDGLSIYWGNSVILGMCSVLGRISK